VASFFVYGAMAAIFAVGTTLVRQDKLTLGGVTAFMFYLLQILLNLMILS
jgi:hypothetical protein